MSGGFRANGRADRAWPAAGGASSFRPSACRRAASRGDPPDRRRSRRDRRSRRETSTRPARGSARNMISTPGVSSSPCQCAGRQPARIMPRGPRCAGSTQTTVRRAHARQRARNPDASSNGAAMLAASTVSNSCAPIPAACQPAPMMVGAGSSAASRARMLDVGSIAVQRRSASRRRSGAATCCSPRATSVSPASMRKLSVPGRCRNSSP